MPITHRKTKNLAMWFGMVEITLFRLAPPHGRVTIYRPEFMFVTAQHMAYMHSPIFMTRAILQHVCSESKSCLKALRKSRVTRLLDT